MLLLYFISIIMTSNILVAEPVSASNQAKNITISVSLTKDVPGNVISLIDRVLYPGGSGRFQSSYEVSGASSAYSITALSKEGDVVLSGKSISRNVELSLESTAVYMAISLIGPQGDLTIDEIETEIKKTKSFTLLKEAIKKSLDEGKVPGRNKEIFLMLLPVTRETITNLEPLMISRIPDQVRRQKAEEIYKKSLMQKAVKESK